VYNYATLAVPFRPGEVTPPFGSYAVASPKEHSLGSAAPGVARALDMIVAPLFGLGPSSPNNIALCSFVLLCGLSFSLASGVETIPFGSYAVASPKEHSLGSDTPGVA